MIFTVMSLTVTDGTLFTLRRYPTHTSKTEDEDHESLATDAELCPLEC